MALKPLHAALIVSTGFVALVIGLGFIFWPLALVVGGAILMVGGALLLPIQEEKPEAAAPLGRIPE